MTFSDGVSAAAAKERAGRVASEDCRKARRWVVMAGAPEGRWEDKGDRTRARAPEQASRPRLPDPSGRAIPCPHRPRQEAPMPRTAGQAYSELTRRAREAAVLAGCASVLAWDEATYMPPKASPFRGE